MAELVNRVRGGEMKVPWPHLREAHFVLSGILLVALLLRVWGIGFGLPYVYHYDEHFYVNTALNLGAGVLNNPPYAPTGLSNILFSQYAAYYLLGKGLGEFSSPQEFELAYRIDPTVFYLLGRLTTALLGTMAVWAVFVVGKSAFGVRSGWLAAGFLATSFLHVRDSHYAVPDVGMSSFVILAVALAAVGLRKKRKRYVYLSAVVGGFAIATKWTAFPVIMPVWWAAVASRDLTSHRPLRTFLSPVVLLSGAFLILGFSLGSPQIILNPQPYLEEALGQYGAGQAGGFEIWQVDTVSGWAFYAKTLFSGVGVVMLGLAAVGLLSKPAPSSRNSTILMLLFPIIYYALMGSTRHYFARYALPLVPFVAVFAGKGTVSVSSWLANRWSSSSYKLIVVALGVLALVQPLALSVKSGILLTRQDTRTTAKHWIETHIPEGARIGVDWPVHTPPLSTPERVVPHSRKTYHVHEVSGEGLSARTVAWYREQGFDYLISSSFIYNIPLVDRERNQIRRDFYSTLEREFELVKEFRPLDRSTELPFVFDEIYGPIASVWLREQPGPTIRIYVVPQGP